MVAHPAPSGSASDVSAPRVAVLGPRASRYCLCIPVINEGERLHAQLYRMRDIAGSVDVVIADGGSTDGSVALPALREFGVRAVIPKSEPGALSTQLRLAFAYALEAGYDGVATMDGNNKDDPASIPLVLRALDLGYDHVQGSRFVPGGRAVATPWTRLVAIRLLHAPVISLAAGVRYTDTTNGFRGYSRRFLLDPRVAPLRPVFRGYELPYYLAAQAGRLGYRVIEVPVTRRYPPGRVPTKIRPLVGHLEILSALWAVWRGRYAPPISPDERETRWPSA